MYLPIEDDIHARGLRPQAAEGTLIAREKVDKYLVLVLGEQALDLIVGRGCLPFRLVLSLELLACAADGAPAVRTGIIGSAARSKSAERVADFASRAVRAAN